MNPQGVSLAKAGYTGEKILPIFPASEDPGPFNSPGDSMMQGPWSIQSWLSWHDTRLLLPLSPVNNNFTMNLRPLSHAPCPRTREGP